MDFVLQEERESKLMIVNMFNNVVKGIFLPKPKYNFKAASYDETYSLLRSLYSEKYLDKHESLYILFFDKNDNYKSVKLFDRKFGSHVNVNLLEFVDILEQNRAKKIVISHNHPSQVLSPSFDDLLITKKIINICKKLNIECLDHWIHSRKGFVSLRESNFLKSNFSI